MPTYRSADEFLKTNTENEREPNINNLISFSQGNTNQPAETLVHGIQDKESRLKSIWDSLEIGQSQLASPQKQTRSQKNQNSGGITASDSSELVKPEEGTDIDALGRRLGHPSPIDRPSSLESQRRAPMTCSDCVVLDDSQASDCVQLDDSGQSLGDKSEDGPLGEDAGCLAAALTSQEMEEALMAEAVRSSLLPQPSAVKLSCRAIACQATASPENAAPKDGFGRWPIDKPNHPPSKWMLAEEERSSPGSSCIVLDDSQASDCIQLDDSGQGPGTTDEPAAGNAGCLAKALTSPELEEALTAEAFRASFLPSEPQYFPSIERQLWASSSVPSFHSLTRNDSDVGGVATAAGGGAGQGGPLREARGCGSSKGSYAASPPSSPKVATAAAWSLVRERDRSPRSCEAEVRAAAAEARVRASMRRGFARR